MPRASVHKASLLTMPDRPDCRSLSERLDEAAAGSSPDLVAHLAACPACAELVRREQALVRLLSAQPGAPPATFAAPALPSVAAMRTGRLLRASWIAAAAAALLVAAVLHVAGPRPSLVQVDAVVDVADAPPPADDPLLALTAGVEAVAMRRPTELR